MTRSTYSSNFGLVPARKRFVFPSRLLFRYMEYAHAMPNCAAQIPFEEAIRKPFKPVQKGVVLGPSWTKCVNSLFY